MGQVKARKKDLHEKNIALAIQAFRKGNYPSIIATAQAFNLPKSPLAYQLNGERVSWQVAHIEQQLLTPVEEKAIVQWRKKLDDWGFPRRLDIVTPRGICTSCQVRGPLICFHFAYINTSFICKISCRSWQQDRGITSPAFTTSTGITSSTAGNEVAGMYCHVRVWYGSLITGIGLGGCDQILTDIVRLSSPNLGWKSFTLLGMLSQSRMHYIHLLLRQMLWICSLKPYSPRNNTTRRDSDSQRLLEVGILCYGCFYFTRKCLKKGKGKYGREKGHV